MIEYIIPWSSEKNLGKAYNDAVRTSDKEYVCFLDRDAMFTTPFYGKQIEDIVKKNPKAGAFTCMTNRVWCKWQIPVGIDQETNDIEYHFKKGLEFQEAHYWEVQDKTQHGWMSGVMILIKKSTWQKIGGFRESGMLGVDNDFHKRLRAHAEKLYLMRGVYVYHWYCGSMNKRNTNHLK